MKSDKTQRGIVTELLPNSQCLVEVGGKQVRCYISGKMKINQIRIAIADDVSIVLDDYGNIGRVVRRNTER